MLKILPFFFSSGFGTVLQIVTKGFSGMEDLPFHVEVVLQAMGFLMFIERFEKNNL